MNITDTTNNPEAPALVLSAQELHDLDQIVANLPTVHGMKFVDFFRLIHQKRQVSLQQAQALIKEQLRLKAEKKRKRLLKKNGSVTSQGSGCDNCGQGALAD